MDVIVPVIPFRYKDMATLITRFICRQFILQRRFYQNLIDDFASNSVGSHDKENTKTVSKVVSCPFYSKESTIQDIKKEKRKVKKFHCIPTPKGLPMIGTIIDVILGGGASMIHEYCDRRHKELGPIYRERLGSVEAVFVAESALIQQVYSNEGKYPQHMVPEPWLIYNEVHGNQRGLFFMDGPRWLQRRRTLNRIFMKQNRLSEQIFVFNSVISELLLRWSTIRDENGILPNLENELYNWSIESLGSMIFGKRLGSVESDGLRDIHEFAHCVQQIFLESARMTMIPPKLAYLLRLPVWRRFEQAANKALQLARSYVEENMKSLVSTPNKSNQADCILSQALLEEKLDGEEIVRIITDLFVAAADTTSHATQWTLYLLAKHPKHQQILVDDIKKVLKPGEVINERHLPRLHYVKAVMKEALRLYPVAPFLTRILTKEIVLGGYQIPKGTLILMSLYTTGRSATYFNEPGKFNPDRWMRSSEISRLNVINSYAFLPFGIGARSCIGRRVAELQMQLLIARAFSIQLANEKDVNIKMRMVTTPDKPIHLKLKERQ